MSVVARLHLVQRARSLIARPQLNAQQCCGLCSSGSSPRLPAWGTFGKTAEQIKDIEAQVREDGHRQAAISRKLAELGLRATAMATRPFQWL